MNDAVPIDAMIPMIEKGEFPIYVDMATPNLKNEKTVEVTTHQLILKEKTIVWTGCFKLSRRQSKEDNDLGMENWIEGKEDFYYIFQRLALCHLALAYSAVSNLYYVWMDFNGSNQVIQCFDKNPLKLKRLLEALHIYFFNEPLTK